MRSGEHHTVHEHLILLGLSAEHRMIFEHQATTVRICFAKFVGGDEARKSTADDDQLVKVIDQGRCGEFRFVNSVADAVRRIHYGRNVAVGPTVIADPGITVPLSA